MAMHASETVGVTARAAVDPELSLVDSDWPPESSPRRDGSDSSYSGLRPV